MLKDLPLHSISDKEVLEAVKQLCPVQSEVKYSNVWHDGNIRNGDRFVYITHSDMNKLLAQLEVTGTMARIFKPLSFTKCKHCGNEGHRPGDLKCLAKAPESMVDDIEVFRGSGNPLSNLHVCVEGCEIQDQGMSFPSSKHHYQFKKLKHHNLGKEAYLLLTEADSFRAIKRAKELVPDNKVSDEWKEKAYDEMLKTN